MRASIARYGTFSVRVAGNTPERTKRLKTEEMRRFEEVANDIVPTETIIRNQQAQIASLERQLTERDVQIQQLQEAISAFKQWQSKVATYNYKYWLEEAVHLMDEMPPIAELKAVRHLIMNRRKCKDLKDYLRYSGILVREETECNQNRQDNE